MAYTCYLFSRRGSRTYRKVFIKLTGVGRNDRRTESSAIRRLSSVLPTPVGPNRMIRVLSIEFVIGVLHRSVAEPVKTFFIEFVDIVFGIAVEIFTYSVLPALVSISSNDMICTGASPIDLLHTALSRSLPGMISRSSMKKARSVI